MAYDLHRRVKDEKDRLSQVTAPPLSAEKAEKLSLLEVEIKKLLEQMEALGEAAKVGEAETLMREVDRLNAEKTAWTQPSQRVAMVTQKKKMALCEICGKFFVANDHSHILGKTHIGYVTVHDFLSEYKAVKEEERLQREKEAEDRRKRRKKEDKRRSSREGIPVIGTSIRIETEMGLGNEKALHGT